MNVDIHDPWVDPIEAEHEYGISVVPNLNEGEYDAVIIAVAHNEFKALGHDGIYKLGKDVTTYLDMKNVLEEAGKDEVRL